MVGLIFEFHFRHNMIEKKFLDKKQFGLTKVHFFKNILN